MSQDNIDSEANPDHLDPEMTIHISDTRLNALIAHPKFDEAMLSAAAALVSFYRGNWLLNRIANDRGRVIAAQMMIDLHFAGGRRGFTVAQLRDQASRYKLCSPNRMTALAALFRVGGLLTPVHAEDSRQRKLAPTAALFDLHRERLRGMLSANALLHPEMRKTIALLDDDAVVGDIARAYLSYWRGGARAIGRDPLLTQLIDRDAAITLLFLLLTGESGGVAYRVSDLARQFSISRTHTSVILREVVAHDCTRNVSPAGPYQDTPRLRHVMRPFFARLFTVQAEAAALTMTRHAARSSQQLWALPTAEA